MGTNYYVYSDGCENNCGHCSLREKIHLGKFSVGWKFLHHIDPVYVRLHGLRFARPLWEMAASNGQIETEYGTPVSFEEMKADIEECQRGSSHIKWLQENADKALYADNHFEWDGYEFSTGEFF
jgi:hypothetical protein